MVNSMDIDKSLNETNQTASLIINNLIDQNEQLHNTSKIMDKIKHDLTMSEVIVKKMKSFWYRIFIWFWGEPKFKDETPLLETTEKKDSEMEDTIDMVNELHKLTCDINKELKKQDTIIDTISDKTDPLVEKSGEVVKIMKKI